MNHPYWQYPISKCAALLFALCILTACATSSPPGAAHTPSFTRETTDLAEVVDDALAAADHVGPDRVLVVFDIDNTLLAMRQPLGSDQWYEWQRSLAESAPCDPARVPHRLAAQGALYFASAMRPTQPDAAELLRRVQDAGIAAFALTSRGPDFYLQTFRELRRSGFDFDPTAPGGPLRAPETFTPARASRETRYEDGVYLTAGQHKGEMLAALLERVGQPLPSVVVIVDDKAGNLAAVRETMDAANVSVHAWRYAGEDEAVAAFDPKAAFEAWQHAEPALRALEDQFGPVHFDLPPPGPPEGCAEN